MNKVLAALKAVLAVLTNLEIPAVAAAVAGVLAPIILGLFGKDFDPAVIAGWLALTGAVAAALQKAIAGTVVPAPPKPAPPVPPAPPTPPPGRNLK